jgi:hypothetical protein
MQGHALPQQRTERSKRGHADQSRRFSHPSTARADRDLRYRPEFLRSLLLQRLHDGRPRLFRRGARRLSAPQCDGCLVFGGERRRATQPARLAPAQHGAHGHDGRADPHRGGRATRAIARQRRRQSAWPSRRAHVPRPRESGRGTAFHLPPGPAHSDGLHAIVPGVSAPSVSAIRKAQLRRAPRNSTGYGRRSIFPTASCSTI